MCQKVNVIVENLERLGFSFRFVDVGGGLGINYDMPENEPIPNFASLFAIVHNHLRVGDREVHFEFGRSIVGECGELITRVLFNLSLINISDSIQHVTVALALYTFLKGLDMEA